MKMITNIFRKKPNPTEVCESKLKKLNEIEKYLNDTITCLYLGHSLPDSLENKRLGVLSNIKYARDRIEKSFASYVYREKEDKFAALQKEVFNLLRNLPND